MEGPIRGGCSGLQGPAARVRLHALRAQRGRGGRVAGESNWQPLTFMARIQTETVVVGGGCSKMGYVEFSGV